MNQLYPLSEPSKAFIAMRRKKKKNKNKAVVPVDLSKRDETERALASDLAAYFAGLADRITIAVSRADEVRDTQ